MRTALHAINVLLPLAARVLITTCNAIGIMTLETNRHALQKSGACTNMQKRINVKLSYGLCILHLLLMLCRTRYFGYFFRLYFM